MSNSLDDLGVFVAVVRAGGFRSAARGLGLSPATVSETIARLEARLDTRLLTRTTRSVTPTEAGRELAARIAPLLAEAEDALAAVQSRRGTLHGRLVLNVPGAVMVDILPPLIEAFMALHPEVEVEIMVDDRMVDAVAAQCDAGIRYGEALAQDMIAVPLGPRRQQAALAAAPSYLARAGVPAHPRDLLGHDCLRGRFSSGAPIPWEFERDGEAITLDVPARLTIGTNGAAAMIGHAISGMGLCMAFRNWLEPHFASGALVPVLADWWPAFEGPYLYFHGRRPPPPLRAFVDFLRAEGRDGA
ncbi:LysR family transcriptional regulator [Pseudooceanicola sp. CBS1P-1]|uniref:LysR family transcriptional regulator n=1 Tax=Pseudooceanicola albus TaxID=2692189 RepID=A0A6L7G937_9RHOB|nr:MULTISPECIES: LysR family transcriptional regulator [Pseudooceanicola]MBT9386568.1 LysR family transcriptional regulator [Pseudooceanicola endophyticus]MXN20601.1 LysR family transcriptional regulator [Pseudooceanicola albus]